MTKRKLSRKIWIAVSTPFQVNYFSPLIERLKGKFDFIITARKHDRIFSILEAKGMDYYPVGKHGGPELQGKLSAYAEGVQELIPLIKDEKPDLLLTERWPEAVRVAFGFNIPAWTTFYDEREYHVNRMVFPLSSKIFVPSFYKEKELARHGVDRESVVWFDGFHACYLKNQVNFGKSPFDSQVILVRPEPEFATFFTHKRRILEDTVQILNKNKSTRDFTIVVIPRTQRQASSYSKYPVTVMNGATVDNPVAYVDVVVGAAETMLMEALVLCKPAISAIYWEKSRPVAELHKYVPHTTDSKEIADLATYYLDPDKQRDFYNRTKPIVNRMENPISKIEWEIKKFYDELDVSKKRVRKRRSWIEIYMDLIHAMALRPQRPTSLMRSANLSYRTLKRYLLHLKKRGLIEEYEDPTGWKLLKATQEGIEVIQEWGKLKEVIS